MNTRSKHSAFSAVQQGMGATLGISRTSLWALLISASTFVMLVVFRTELLSLPLQTLCITATGGVFACLILVANLYPTGVWSAPSVYLIMFALFHFGLVTVFGFGVLSEEMRRIVSSWFLSSRTPLAIYLSTLGMVSFAIGAATSALLDHHQQKRVIVSKANIEFNRSLSHYFVIIGFLLVVTSIFWWMVISIMSGGLYIFVGTYRNYLDATAGQPLALLNIFVALGLSIVSLSSGERSIAYRRWAYLSFLLYAALATPLGLRGEILVPILAAVTIRAHQGTRPSLKSTILLGTLLLFGISFIRSLRQMGLAMIGSGTVSVNAFDALAEMGSSLRPTTDVLEWLWQGDSLLRGASYWAPFDRALCTIAFDPTCLPAREDFRLLNVLIAERVGPVGFSPVAEATFNFGNIGVTMVMFLLGFGLGCLTRADRSTIGTAMVAVVLVPLLYNVRSAFTSFPIQLFVGFVVVICAVALSKMFPLRGKYELGSKHAHVQRTSGSIPKPKSSFESDLLYHVTIRMYKCWR